MFYIDNFVARVLFCVVLCVLGANLGMFVRAQFITHVPFVFSVVKGLILPAGLGVLSGIMWKPKN